MSSVLRKYKWFRAIRELKPVSEIASGYCFSFWLLFFSSGVTFLFLWWMKMNLRLTLDDKTDFSRPHECEMMMTYNMILFPANDAKWREHESSEKLNRLRVNDRKWYENDRMLRAIRKKSRALFRSWLLIEKFPGSNNVEYLYFQIYTHNTGDLQHNDGWGDGCWNEWMGMDVVTMIVMTLITMVRYSRIFARHDNPSLYVF